MKQLLLDLNSGNISIEDVPIPALKKGVIVKNYYSLISGGTEGALLNFADKSLIGKAISRPDLFQKVLNQAKNDGFLSAYSQAMGRVSKPEPLGYSSSGIVIQSNVDEFKIGDSVACGGVGFAAHAEYVYIPKNLCINVPQGVSLRDASFTTVGAIAMQGVRNAKVSVGDRVVVIGLGLVGLLSVQILKACGCRVLGVDIDQYKLSIAQNLGADKTVTSENATAAINNFSEFGADVVIITAATKSNSPVILAGELVRDKGRVVIVGSVGMELPRDIYYQKEAEIVVSRSYGPGRYDRNFEEKGIDYPIYVRWTEKRNMEAFLELVAGKKINLDQLITHEFGLEEAVDAYNLIREGNERYIGIVLRYGTESINEGSQKVNLTRLSEKKRDSSGTITIGLIGGGIQARSALLPNLVKLPFILKGIATTTGSSSLAAGKKYGFEYCTTDYHDLLNDSSINAVIIATRNETHSRFTNDALKAGKNVFVEKPLATSIEELKEIVDTWKKYQGTVMVGFNRRYSPLTEKLKLFFLNRQSPLIMQYRVNAGFIPANHWIHDDEQGGNMLITECCHFIDYLQFVTNSIPIKVFANPIKTQMSLFNSQENLQINISYKDGSIGAITYTTHGDRSYSKEMVEIFGDQSVGVIQDFRNITLIKKGKITKERIWLRSGKGFFEELQKFSKGNIDEFERSLYSTLTTLTALKSLNSGSPELIDITEIGLS